MSLHLAKFQQLLGPFLSSQLCLVGLALATLGCSESDASEAGGSGAGSGGAASGGSSTGGAGNVAGGPAGGAASAGASGSAGAAASAGASGGAGGSTSNGGTSAGGNAASGAGGTAADPTCSAGVWDQSTPEVLTLSGDTFAHDPTMIKVGNLFYRFWTGDSIPSATSTNLTQWQGAPSVYGGSYSAWVADWLDGVANETFNFPWAPDVSSFGGSVHIYSSFSAKFGDNISCITHLSTSDIAGGDWTDHGPVICTEGTENYNAIDADVGLDQDGTPWLAFGSFWSGIKAIKLNSDGSRADNEMASLAWANEIEAPVLFYRCGHYYLFVTWGLCCPGEGRTIDQLTYRVAVGRSENILGPYSDKNGVAMMDGGGTLVVEGDGVNWAAAGHSDVIIDAGKIYHLYHAYRQSNGGAQLRIAELPFDEDGWPVPHAP